MANQSHYESSTRAGGDAMRISDLQSRLREPELQCQSLQSVFQERTNEQAAKGNTLYQKMQQQVQ